MRISAYLWGLPLLGLVAMSSQAPARNASDLSAPAGANASTAARIAASYGVITSGWRSVAHNRAVGGVPNSHHLRGAAIDVARKPGVSHGQIATALRAAGLNLIESLDEGDHSHFAFGPARAVTGALPSPPTAAPEPVKPGPANPLVEADRHGVLYVDLQAAGAQ